MKHKELFKIKTKLGEVICQAEKVTLIDLGTCLPKGKIEVRYKMTDDSEPVLEHAVGRRTDLTKFVHKKIKLQYLFENDLFSYETLKEVKMNIEHIKAHCNLVLKDNDLSVDNSL